MKSLIVFNLFLLLSLTASAKSFLIVTDSHGEQAFGDELIKILEEKTQEVHSYNVGGSTAKDWLHGLQQLWGYREFHTGSTEIRSMKEKTPVFSKILKKHNPDVVIIELGTNNYWGPFTETQQKDLIDLATQASADGRKCYWVGPPDVRLKDQQHLDVQKAFIKFIENDFEKYGCKLFKSWTVTKYPSTGGDGIHYSENLAPAAQKWARGALKFILQD